MDKNSLGEFLTESLSKYTTEKEKEIHSAALKIQKEMLNEVTARSPVQDYSHNGGERRRIIVHRMKKSPAKYGSWGNKFSPGSFQAGWIKSTQSPKGKQKIYAVRNKKAPNLVHLVNFRHDHFSHKKYTGEINGNYENPEFVTKVQDKGIEKFGKEIKDILNK